MNSLLVSKEKVEVTKMGKSKTEGDKYGSKKKKKGGGMWMENAMLKCQLKNSKFIWNTFQELPAIPSQLLAFRQWSYLTYAAVLGKKYTWRRTEIHVFGGETWGIHFHSIERGFSDLNSCLQHILLGVTDSLGMLLVLKAQASDTSNGRW